MASPNDPRRRNMDDDDLPRLAYSFKCLGKELIELVKNDYPEIQQCMNRLCDILKTYEDKSKLAAAGSKHGKNSGIAGGVMMGLGIALSPFTVGASAVVLGGAGVAVATGGLAGSAVWKSKKSSMQAKFREDFEAELKEFQNKLFHMSGEMKHIDRLVMEILRDINNPNHKVSYLDKYFASAYAVNMTGEITGIVAQGESNNEFSDLRDKIIQFKKIMNAIRIMLTRNNIL